MPVQGTPAALKSLRNGRSESDTRVHTLLQVCIGRGWGKVGASFKAPKCVRALCVADGTPGAAVAFAMRKIHQVFAETYTCCSTEAECCQRTSLPDNILSSPMPLLGTGCDLDVLIFLSTARARHAAGD